MIIITITIVIIIIISGERVHSVCKVVGGLEPIARILCRRRRLLT